MVVPEHLRCLVLEDWHPTDRVLAAELWQAARRDWLYEHRDEVSGVDFITDGFHERRRVLFGIEPAPLGRAPRRRGRVDW